MDFIEEVKQNAEDRSVVVWGTDQSALKCYYILKYNNINPLLMSDKHKEIPKTKGIPVHGREILDKDKVFVIVINRTCANILKSNGFVHKKDYILKTEGLLFYDFIWDGVFVGKFTPDFSVFSNCLGVHSRHNCITSIGRYCSFNGKAYMNGDHQMEGLTISQHFLRYVDSLQNKQLKKYNDYLEAYNKITIGNDVWIGANVFINASKVKSIGNGAMIGANAVVLEDVPPYAVVVGVPGKVKKYRFTQEQIEILERVKWWDWDEETIKKNADCFENVNVFFERFKADNNGN